MQIDIVTQEKNLLEVQVDNGTIAEILRVYLNRQGCEFVAWRKDHPTKPALLRIESSGKTVAKEVSEAVAAIKKDLQAFTSVVKK